MDCRRSDALLDALLGGTLSPAGRDELERHARTCTRCADLLSVATAEFDAAPSAAPAGLAESVLARTSGSPCERAQRLLAERAGGALEALDGALLARHLAGCEPCRAIAAALEALDEALPALAAVDAGPELLARVIARTSRAPRRRLAAAAARLGAAWHHLLLRPRFAAEAAYAFSLALVAIVLALGGSLASLPFRAAELAGAVPRAASLDAVPLAPIGTRIDSEGAALRSALVQRVDGALGEARRHLDDAAGYLRRLGTRVGLERDEARDDDAAPAPDASPKETER